MAVAAMLFCFLWPVSLSAQAVPQHLASMAAQVHGGAVAALDGLAVDAERARVLEEVRQALHRAGVRHWARTPVTLPDGAARLADMLRLDLNAAEDRQALEALLDAGDDGTLRERMRTLLARQGEEAGDEAVNDRVGDLADRLLDLRAQMPTTHSIALDRNRAVNLEWRPEAGRFLLQVTGEGDDESDRFAAAMLGDIAYRTDPETGALRLDVQPHDSPPTLLTAADLERLRESIFGDWLTAGGRVFRIAPGDAGDTGSVGAAAERQARVQGLDQRISSLRDRLTALQQGKEHVWENPETGQVVRQQRFRRLDDPFVYQGQQHRREDAPARLEEMERQLDALQTERQAVGGADAGGHDPVGFAEQSRAPASRAVTVTEIDPDGHAYPFDKAWFDGRRLVAERIMTVPEEYNPALPGSVAAELIRAWHPKRWLELEASLDPVSGELSLQGLRWALRVRYTSFIGGTVESVGSPYGRPLSLKRSREELVVSELRFVQAFQFGFQPVRDLFHGRTYHLQARFEDEPEGEEQIVMLDWGQPPVREIKVIRSGEDRSLYRSGPLLVAAPPGSAGDEEAP